MTVGFEAVNTNGSIQIDETYRNMLLIASNNFTVTDTTGTFDLWYQHQIANIPVMTAAAMMAVRAEGPWGVRVSIGSYRGLRKFMNMGHLRGSVVKFQYYVFDLVAPSMNNMGMQIFDSVGNLIYDAMDYPLRIVGTAFTDFNVPGNRYTIYTGTHNNYAVACLGGGLHFNDDGVDLEGVYAYTYCETNKVISYYVYDDQGAEGSGQGIGNWGATQQALAIVDVSNIPLIYKRP